LIFLLKRKLADEDHRSFFTDGLSCIINALRHPYITSTSLGFSVQGPVPAIAHPGAAVHQHPVAVIDPEELQPGDTHRNDPEYRVACTAWCKGIGYKDIGSGCEYLHVQGVIGITAGFRKSLHHILLIPVQQRHRILNIIPAEAEQRLDRKPSDLQRRTRHQFAIVTISSLQGYNISDYANRLGRSWGVGRRHYDDGVLMVVAPNEHRVRIEVGYGLEATLTDPRCAEIIRDQILPRFKLQDFPGGITAAADAIIARLASAAPLEKPRAS